MALSVSSTRTRDRVAYESDADVNAENDIASGACTLYGYRITNTGGVAGTCYVKLYNLLGASNANVPFMNLYMRAGEIRSATFPQGIPFDVGLCLRCAQQADDTGASADPADTVTVELIFR